MKISLLSLIIFNFTVKQLKHTIYACIVNITKITAPVKKQLTTNTRQ